MKKKSIIMMALALALGATQAKAQTEEQTVAVDNFDKISLMGNIDVIFSQDSKTSVVIVGNRKDIDKVEAEVKGSTLVISTKTEKKNVGGVTVKTTKFIDEVKVKVASKNLKEVKITGSGDFKATTDIKTDNLNLNISGSGDMEFKKVTADAAKVNIAGSGDISMKQIDTKNLNTSIAGSGEIEIDNVTDRCDIAQLSIAGSGEMKMKFEGCRDLRCKIAGSGEIELKGKVGDYTSAISGMGEIDKKELTITGKTTESDS
ncbi:MAG: head GIN domain-containing protein, partial [Agathobacter sp.]